LARRKRRATDIRTALNPARVSLGASLGAVEGLNNELKASIRRAYGFRTADAIKIMLYHKLGELPEPQLTHRFC
jgi:transposase